MSVSINWKVLIDDDNLPVLSFNQLIAAWNDENSYYQDTYARVEFRIYLVEIEGLNYFCLAVSEDDDPSEVLESFKREFGRPIRTAFLIDGHLIFFFSAS